MDFIEERMRSNDELTSRGNNTISLILTLFIELHKILVLNFFTDLHKLLFKEFDIVFSEATIKRVRRKLGWVKTGPAYCQLVREKNRIERLAFCNRIRAADDQFDNVIFTDESSIWLEQHGKLCFRKIGKLNISLYYNIEQVY